jgi:glucose-6-phosphate isomerase
MNLKFNFSEIPEQNQLLEFQKQYSNKWEDFKRITEDENFGFFKLVENNEYLSSCQEIYNKFQHKKHFVHIGIGGSSLGPEMLVSALKKDTCSRNFTFINNIDPDQLHSQLKNIDIKESLFYFVSKSGGTAETMAIFSILINHFNISNNELKDYFVICTDQNNGEMREIVNDFNLSSLPVPSNIGGRFSVLTPVGLFPALFADIKIQQIYQGAQQYAQDITSSDPESNSLMQAATFLAFLKKHKSINQTVLMPYSSKLRDLSFWFVQLWAESLGKKFSKDNKIVNEGFTPIPGYGATDQHSQMQLFMEGPYDKCLVLIEVEHFQHCYPLNNSFNAKSLKSLAPYSLNQLIQAELKGTLRALQDAQRPFINISIDNNNEQNLGALILFFESLTVLMGEFLSINPFDQPGVELGKKYAYEVLGQN